MPFTATTAEARAQLLGFWDMTEADLGTGSLTLTEVGPNTWTWVYVDSMTNDHGDFWLDSDGLWQTSMDQDSTSY